MYVCPFVLITYLLQKLDSFRALLPRTHATRRCANAAGDPSTGRPRSDVADVRPARPSARRLEQLGRGAPGRDGGSLLHPSDNLQHGRLARMGNLPRSHATARCPGRLGRAASGSGCCTLVVCPSVRAHSHQFPCLGPCRLTLVAVRRRRGRGLRVRRGAPGGVPARRGRAAERVRQGVRGEALQGPLSDAARQRRQHVLHRQRPAGRDHAAESEGIDLPDQRRWPAAAAPAARGARPPVRPRARPRRARHLCRREDAGATPCL